MFKFQNIKECLFNIFFKYSKILVILNAIVLAILIVIPPIYYVSLCVMSLFLWSVFSQSNIISYCACDLKKFKETSLIKKCETIGDIIELKHSIEVIDRELIRNILLYYLNNRRINIEKGLIDEFSKYKEFNKK